MRRRQRRLRSWLRHERTTVAMALAEMTHLTAPRGPKMARAGEEGHEEYDDDRSPLLPSWSSSSCSKKSPAGCGPRLSLRCPLLLYESQIVDQLVAVIKLVDFVVPEEINAVPKISWPSRFPRTVLREPQKAEQLVEVLVPVPSFSDWVRWEETYRRTGHTWLAGFGWRLIPSRGATASPGLFQNTGQGSRQRPWYHAAPVPAVQQQIGRHIGTTGTHSANCAVLGSFRRWSTFLNSSECVDVCVNY